MDSSGSFPAPLSSSSVPGPGVLLPTRPTSVKIITLKISLMAHFSATWSASDHLITREQKHGLKRHKHQKIEQGKGYNMILITPFGFKMS